MKKYTSSSSRNEEWPSAHKRRRLLRWVLVLALSLAAVGSAGISLNADNLMKYLKLSSANGGDDPIFSDDTTEAPWPAENNVQPPLLKNKATPEGSGMIPVPWDAIANLNSPKQDSSIDNSTRETETQPLPRTESELPSQGSDNTSGGPSEVKSQSFTQQASIEVPSAPAVGRVPPVRPPPTPTPTPYPIRSPQ